MTRIWFCRTCGYEVRSRGRCHNCREKLTPSALPELETGAEDEEVGYNIEGWSEADRAALIERLNDLAIMHRFEDEELVVDASDEERVDDLVAILADSVDLSEAGDSLPGDESALDDLDGSGAARDAETDLVDPALDAAVRLLADAAARLHRDPTDMQADADVAEASAAVFVTDTYGPLDEETWTAVGRVTRRLLSLLGAEEALEDGIRSDAAVLEKLLAPVAGRGSGSRLELGSEGAAALGGAVGGTPVSPAVVEGEKTVYELPEWMPEQRAQLGVFLDDAGIAHEWEGDELIVPASREDEVEDLFGRVGGVDSEESDEEYEARYQAVAELFAACGRLASEPSDDQRRQAVLGWISQSAGAPLFGMDELDWFRITTHFRTLEAAIEDGTDGDLIGREADTLHDLLRAVV